MQVHKDKIERRIRLIEKLILPPVRWVVYDIIGNIVECHYIPDNAVVKTTLPYFVEPNTRLIFFMVILTSRVCDWALSETPLIQYAAIVLAIFPIRSTLSLRKDLKS